MKGRLLQHLLRLALSPISPATLSTLSSGFGPEPVGRHFTSTKHVHMTGIVPPGQTSCTHTWLYLLPVLWPIFTHTAKISLLTNRATTWMHDYIYKYSLASVCAPCNITMVQVFIGLSSKHQNKKNTVVVSHMRTVDPFLMALDAGTVFHLSLQVGLK